MCSSLPPVVSAHTSLLVGRKSSVGQAPRSSREPCDSDQRAPPLQTHTNAIFLSACYTHWITSHVREAKHAHTHTHQTFITHLSISALLDRREHTNLACVRARERWGAVGGTVGTWQWHPKTFPCLSLSLSLSHTHTHTLLTPNLFYHQVPRDWNFVCVCV